jgi:hypothetical protein
MHSCTHTHTHTHTLMFRYFAKNAGKQFKDLPPKKWDEDDE